MLLSLHHPWPVDMSPDGRCPCDRGLIASTPCYMLSIVNIHKTHYFVGFEDNLQNEEASSRSQGQGRRLAKHISLEQARHQRAPSPPAPSDWAALNLQMQRLQVQFSSQYSTRDYLSLLCACCERIWCLHTLELTGAHTTKAVCFLVLNGCFWRAKQ